MTSKKRILIADDDEPTARILARFLRDYDVVVASDGRQALERVVEHKPDLVIADMCMRVLDGVDMLQAMKGDPALSHVPVILVTAAVTAEHAARCISAGARHFLPKPVNVGQLLHAVHRELD